MQSRKPAAVALTLTLATGAAGAAANYYLLTRFWGWPPTVLESITMAAFYGSLSFAVKYPILRFFNAIGW